MSDKLAVGFIGYGNMGDAIGRSLLNSSLVQTVSVVEQNPDRQTWIRNERSDIDLLNIDELIKRCSVIFIAVKPQQFANLAIQLKGAFNQGQLIISMMAGVSIDTCTNLLEYDQVIRIMPNTPAALHQGVTGIFYPPNIRQVDCQKIDELCSTFGYVVSLKNESDIHAITALSGSGPAFFYRMVKACVQFAKDQGFDNDQACQLVNQTMMGAGAMLDQTPNPQLLIDQVTSPNGTTFAGLQAMDSDDFDKLMYNVLERAKNRSIELSKEA